MYKMLVIPHDADSRAERVERHSNQIILPHFGITSSYFFVSYPRHFHLDGSKTCFFSRILSFYLSTLELYSEKIIVQYSSKKTCYIDFAYFSNRLYKINLFFCFIFFSLYGFLCLQFFSSKSFVVDGSKGIVLCQKRCICWMHKQHICFAHARI